LDDVTQQFTYQAADINFRDPQGLIQGPIAEFNFPNEGLNFEVDGRFPMNFSSVTMYNKIGTWNVELNALYRTYPSHWGGQCEFTFGPRYMEINEDFSASAVGGFTTLAGDTSAGTSWWTMRTENHIVGPQVGLRWFRKFSRFTTSLETKFMAGLNQQNFKLRYNLAPGLSSVSGTAGYPATYAGSAGATAQYVTEFAPVVELRADVRYQLTRNFSLRAGWNGIWMDGVARASNSIIYQVPNMGINSANNRQNMLIHGLTVGVDINR
jgi:hypothetical protein